jgi:hypothetical protein
MSTKRSVVRTWDINRKSVAYTWQRRRTDGRLFAYSLLVTDCKAVWSGYVWDDISGGWCLISRFPFGQVPLTSPVVQSLVYRTYSMTSPV